MILFTKEYVEPILSGDKNSTIRYWLSKRCREGQIRDARTGYAKSSTFAKLKILEVRPIHAPTDAEAIALGYNSAREFHDTYRRLYGNKRTDTKRTCYYVRFEGRITTWMRR